MNTLHTSHLVFLTDCQCITENLQSSSDHLTWTWTVQKLTGLARTIQVSLHWIPAHCSIRWNEQADSLAKAGSRLQQPQHPISFSIMKQTFHYVPKRRKDPVCCFERRQQTTIFCLRTGHSCLFKHMCWLGLAHIKDCPCQTGPQSPQHFLQFCPLFREARTQQWPMEQCSKNSSGAKLRLFWRLIPSSKPPDWPLDEPCLTTGGRRTHK